MVHGVDVNELLAKLRLLAMGSDRERLLHGEENDCIQLLGPHDPYLDLRDRDTVLPDQRLQRQVWRTVGNPGAVLHGGRVAGLWSARAQGDRLAVSVTLFEALTSVQRAQLEELVQGYAAFRGTALQAYTVS